MVQMESFAVLNWTVSFVWSIVGVAVDGQGRFRPAGGAGSAHQGVWRGTQSLHVVHHGSPGRYLAQSAEDYP